MVEPEQITKPCLFYVEGKDEVSFFESFWKKLGILDCQAIHVDGKNNFEDRLKGLISVTGYKRVSKLALVRDADENYENALKSLQGMLAKLNLPVPEGDGKIKVGEALACGIYIMPRSQSIGMLEDLCLESLAGTKEMACIESFLGCVSEKPKNLAKTKAQIYLSIQKEMANSLGIGAKKGYWDFDHPCFDDLKKFMEAIRSAGPNNGEAKSL